MMADAWCVLTLLAVIVTILGEVRDRAFWADPAVAFGSALTMAGYAGSPW
jgi:hypothetical protein